MRCHTGKGLTQDIIAVAIKQQLKLYDIFIKLSHAYSISCYKPSTFIGILTIKSSEKRQVDGKIPAINNCYDNPMMGFPTELYCNTTFSSLLNAKNRVIISF